MSINKNKAVYSFESKPLIALLFIAVNSLCYKLQQVPGWGLKGYSIRLILVGWLFLWLFKSCDGRPYPKFIITGAKWFCYSSVVLLYTFLPIDVLKTVVYGDVKLSVFIPWSFFSAWLCISIILFSMYIYTCINVNKK